MDRTSQRLRRRYHETLDVHDWAKWIAHEIRAGNLEKDSVALMAYLKHPGCQLVFSDFVRGNTFLYFNHAMRNDEPNDIRGHLRKWGNRATITAACGVIMLLANRSYMGLPMWTKDVGTVSTLAHTYQPRKSTELRKVARESINSARGVSSLSQRLFNSLLRNIKYGRNYPGLDVIRIANGWTSDECILKGMRQGVSFWTLGDYA